MCCFGLGRLPTLSVLCCCLGVVCFIDLGVIVCLFVVSLVGLRYLRVIWFDVV